MRRAPRPPGRRGADARPDPCSTPRQEDTLMLDRPPPLSRRTVLGGLLGAAGAAALGGCGSLGSSPKVREWNLFGGGDGARLLQIHDRYVAEHPDVRFE